MLNRLWVISEYLRLSVSVLLIDLTLGTGFTDWKRC